MKKLSLLICTSVLAATAFAQSVVTGHIENKSTSSVDLFFYGHDQAGKAVELPLTRLSQGGRLLEKKRFLRKPKIISKRHLEQIVYDELVSCYQKDKNQNQVKLVVSDETFKYALTRSNDRTQEVYLMKYIDVPENFLKIECKKQQQ